MNDQIKLSADKFVEALKDTLQVREYLNAVDEYNSNSEMKKLLDKYYRKSNDFSEIQKSRALTEEEKNEMKSIVNEINTHFLTKQIQKAEVEMLELLIDCNVEISSVLELDFAKTAAPQSSCCG